MTAARRRSTPARTGKAAKKPQKQAAKKAAPTPAAPKVPSKVGREALAAVLGVDARSITNFASEGMPKDDHGVYPLAGCVQWYVARERDRVKASRELNDLDQARQRRANAEARQAEISVAEKESRLIPIELHRERLQARLETVAGNVKANGRYHADVKLAVSDDAVDALLARMADEQLAELFELKDTIE